MGAKGINPRQRIHDGWEAEAPSTDGETFSANPFWIISTRPQCSAQKPLTTCGNVDLTVFPWKPKFKEVQSVCTLIPRLAPVS